MIETWSVDGIWYTAQHHAYVYQKDTIFIPLFIKLSYTDDQA